MPQGSSAVRTTNGLYLLPFTLQRSILTKSEDHCLCSNTCTPQYPNGEVRN